MGPLRPLAALAQPVRAFLSLYHPEGARLRAQPVLTWGFCGAGGGAKAAPRGAVHAGADAGDAAAAAGLPAKRGTEEGVWCHLPIDVP